MIAAFGPSLRYRWLLWSFARREIANRFRGSVTGALWAVLHPLALLAIFSAVFTLVFRVKLPDTMAGTSYATVVALALWPWMMFSEALTRGLAAIAANGDLIRKVAFPHRLLVYASVLVSFAIHGVGFLAVLLALKAMGEPVALAGLPAALLLLVPLALIAIGLAAALAALHTLMRDVEPFVTIVLTIVFYATPVLYLAEQAPPELRSWIDANPLGHLLGRIRSVLLEGGFLTAGDLVIAAVALAVAVAGLAFFERLSPFFEDFL